MVRRSGFTLLQSIVVLVVFIVLVVLGNAKYQAMVTESRQKSCMSNLAALNSAYAMFETRNGSIPVDDACTQVINPVSGEPATTHPNAQVYWQYRPASGTFREIPGTDLQTKQLMPQGAITVPDEPARVSELLKIVHDAKTLCCPELARRYGDAQYVPVPAVGADPATSNGPNGHVLYQFFKAPSAGSQAGTDFETFNSMTYSANNHLRIYGGTNTSGDAHIKLRRGVICRAYGRYNNSVRGLNTYQVRSNNGITQQFLAGAGPDLSSATLHVNFAPN